MEGMVEEGIADEEVVHKSRGSRRPSSSCAYLMDSITHEVYAAEAIGSSEQKLLAPVLMMDRALARCPYISRKL